MIFMKEQFNIYVARNGERYIQTGNYRLADAVAYLTGARYYKLAVPTGTIYSFQYSEKLIEIVNKLDSLRIE